MTILGNERLMNWRKYWEIDRKHRTVSSDFYQFSMTITEPYSPLYHEVKMQIVMGQPLEGHKLAKLIKRGTILLSEMQGNFNLKNSGGEYEDD